jgi:hypothetical protein
MVPMRAMPRKTRDAGATRVDRPQAAATPRTQGFATMATEILHLAAQFQVWVNQLVARHLEAQAAKFAR